MDCGLRRNDDIPCLRPVEDTSGLRPVEDTSGLRPVEDTSVIPAKAGIQCVGPLDCGLRRNDDIPCLRLDDESGFI